MGASLFVAVFAKIISGAPPRPPPKSSAVAISTIEITAKLPAVFRWFPPFSLYLRDARSQCTQFGITNFSFCQFGKCCFSPNDGADRTGRLELFGTVWKILEPSYSAFFPAGFKIAKSAWHQKMAGAKSAGSADARAGNRPAAGGVH